MMLDLFAGKQAIAHIEQNGLKPDDVKVLVGAAGGPKWLVLFGLDQYLFGEFLPASTTPTHLLGSSIGAWRYAAYCQHDFDKAFSHFKEVYFAQQYSEKADRKEVTEVITGMLHQLYTPDACQQILSHPKLRLNMFADASKGIVNSDKGPLLVSGLLLATLANLVSRKTASWFFDRVLLHHPTDLPPFMAMDDLPTKTLALTQENLPTAILASGSIPMVVEGIKFDEQPKVNYRDGGLVDYHINVPFGIEQGIVLQPHFSRTYFPGWLDKYLKLRKANLDFMSNQLIVCPSLEFIAQLPFAKIPDRTDFQRFKADNNARIDYWKAVTSASQQLADELQQLIDSEQLAAHLKPIEQLIS